MYLWCISTRSCRATMRFCISNYRIKIIFGIFFVIRIFARYIYRNRIFWRWCQASCIERTNIIYFRTIRKREYCIGTILSGDNTAWFTIISNGIAKPTAIRSRYITIYPAIMPNYCTFCQFMIRFFCYRLQTGTGRGCLYWNMLYLLFLLLRLV